MAAAILAFGKGEFWCRIWLRDPAFSTWIKFDANIEYIHIYDKSLLHIFASNLMQIYAIVTG